ncbi:MAG TPA: NrsF family protein [Polyangiales bacterium]|nr:NrsF family protein [Polyangiales bacterium]
MSDPTREHLMRLLAQAPSLTRTQLRKRVSLAYGVAIASVLGVFLAVGGTTHSEPRALSATAVLACGLLLLAALSSRVIAKRASSPLGPSGRLLAGVLACTPCGLLAWLALMQPTEMYAEIPIGFRCLALSVVMGGLLLGAMTYSRRASDPVHPGWLGGALGASAAAWSAALVAAWCPLYDLPHILIGHVAPVLVLSAAGCVLARRALRL